MRRLKQVIVALVHSAIALATLLLAIVLAAMLALRTDAGRARALTLATAQLQRLLAGRVSVGRLDGDPVRGLLILHDAEIDDADGRPAIRARRIEARYRPLALFGPDLQIDEVRGEGVWLRLGPLRDGRFNLAALGVVSPHPELAERIAPRSGRPFALSFRRVVLDGTVRYEPPTNQPALQVIEGKVQVEGALGIGREIAIAVRQVDIGLVQPTAATLTGAGGATIDGGRFTLRKVALQLGFEAAALRRLLPEWRAKGPVQLVLDADGRSDAVTVAIQITPPRGRISVDGLLGLAGEHLTWRGTLRGDHLDPGAVWTGVPHGEVSLAASGKGSDARGEVRLDWLRATAAGARAHASGHSDFAGFGELRAEVEVRDLTRLRTLGAPAIAGRLSAKATLTRTPRALTVDGDARVSSLVLPEVRIDRLDAHLASVDASGDATLAARGVRAGSLHLAQLSAVAHGDRRAVSLKIDSDGPRATRLALSAHGVPVFSAGRDGRPIGVDAQVDGILFMTHRREWKTARPFRVHADPDVLRLEGLRLASGSQRLTLDGAWRRGGAISGIMRADGLDARELEPIIAPGQRLPQTDLHLAVHLHGSSAAPIADVELAGRSLPDEATGLLQIQGHLNARYAAGRIRGEMGADIAGQSMKAHADLPVSASDGSAGIGAELEFGVLFDPVIGGLLLPALTDLMPLPLRDLQGKISGELNLAGTVGAPRLASHLHLGAWGSSPIKGSADLALRYDSARVEATFGARLSSLPAGGGAGGGTVDASLSSAIDLGSILVLPGRLARSLLSTPVTATASGKAIDLAHVPFAALGIDLPGAAGTVDGTLSLGGTLGNPVLAIHLAGENLAGPHVDRGAAVLTVDYRQQRALVSTEISLRGAPLLRLSGSAAIDPARLRHWREIPIRLEGEVPLYPLARVPELGPSIGGSLGATLAVRGTIGRPEGKAHLRGEKVHVGAVSFSRLGGDAGFDGDTLRLAVDAAQPGGLLHLAATVPIAPSLPWSIAARAKEFVLDLESMTLPGLRTARGIVNADLLITGTRVRPTLRGAVRVERGALALAASPMLYQDVGFDLAFNDGRAVLRRFDAAAAGGTLHVTAAGRLDGFAWRDLDGQAVLHRFPLRAGGVSARIDAHADLNARRQGRTLRGSLVIRDGIAELSDLISVRALQSTTPPTDVRYIDAAGQRSAASAARAISSRHADEVFTLSLPGPFLVRSRELQLDLAGELRLVLLGDAATADGRIESRSGTVVLFSQRYSLDHARVAMNGAGGLDPSLDIRLSRPVTDATITVDIHGSAAHPEVTFTALPPIYTEAQIVGLILSGNSGSLRISDQSLDNQVMGALSVVIVNALKTELAPGLPIDVMKVGLERDLEGLQRTRLEVGKYIGAGIYASYVHQFEGAATRRRNQNQLQIDYRIGRRFVLQSSFGDAGVGGLDLYWTRQF